jgi:hypothetical protein
LREIRLELLQTVHFGCGLRVTREVRRHQIIKTVDLLRVVSLDVRAEKLLVRLQRRVGRRSAARQQERGGDANRQQRRREECSSPVSHFLLLSQVVPSAGTDCIPSWDIEPGMSSSTHTSFIIPSAIVTI